MADQLSRGDSYRLFGTPSAFHPVGYPFLLTPVAFLARVTGGFSLAYGAALVNAVAATVTVALGGLLAGRWFGRRARTVAAWVLALAPGQIYLTAVALAETAFTTLVMASVLAVTVVILRSPALRRGQLVALGALTGYAVLVRTPGTVLVLLALIALWVRLGSIRQAVGPAAWLLLGVVVVLAPWTVRNGVEIGLWSPASTNNAAFLCTGHRDGATGRFDDTFEGQRYCFEGSPFDPQPEEADWYVRTVRRAVGWALTHPAEEVRLTITKTADTFDHDREALVTARDFGNRPLASPATRDRLDLLADAWHWGVLVLAAVGLFLIPAVRRAWPIWATVVGQVVLIWGGIALGRYHAPFMPLLAVLASATLVAMGRWASAGIRSTAGDEGDGEDQDDTPVDAAAGLARASRPRGRLGGPADHPFLPVVAGIALGAWVCALGFDAFSFVADTEWVYARGAWLLTGLGLLAGLVAAFLALDELLGIPRDTVAFRVGVRRLVALDVALVAFTVSFLVRNDSDFLFHDPSPTLAVLASLVGLGAAAWSTWQAGILTYRYGVRVAPDAERVKGFEPVRE